MDINRIDLQKIRDSLATKEGDSNKVYLDSKNIPTVGKGHRITTDDILEVGDTITDAHKNRLFDRDVQRILDECLTLYPAFYIYPVGVQEALYDMTYNMGEGSMSSFHNFNSLVYQQQWGMVADHMKNNMHPYYNDVGARAVENENKFRQAARGI